MKKEDMVCTFEQAKKIHNSGVENLSTLFVWGKGSDNIYKLQFNIEFCGESEYCSFIPAYTVAELGVLLPISLPNEEEDYEGDEVVIFQRKRGWGIDIWYEDIYQDVIVYPKRTHRDDEKHDGFFTGKTEAQARADALIWLLENEHVNPKNLKL